MVALLFLSLVVVVVVVVVVVEVMVESSVLWCWQGVVTLACVFGLCVWLGDTLTAGWGDGVL
jgi:hypothetical protein